MECNYVLMTYIRDSIQNMDKQNHIEVLKMLKKHNNIVINSNKSGIRINLSELDNNIINELLNYIKHIQMLEKNLNVLERQKEEITNDFF